MLGSAIIETAIGLSLVFALFSLLASAAQELLASVIGLRAAFLQQGLAGLLDGPSLANQFLEHPMMRSVAKPQAAPPTDAKRETRRQPSRRSGSLPAAGRLGTLSAWKTRWDLPSYIQAGQFSSVLLDIVSRKLGIDGSDPRTLVELRRRIENEADGSDPDLRSVFDRERFGGVLLHLIDRAERRATGTGEAELLEEIGAWFDSGMEQVSAWYKRHSQKWILVLGFLLAAAFNVDAIHITTRLYEDPALRARAVAAAELVGSMPEQQADSAAVAQAFQAALDAATTFRTQAAGAGIPIGWNRSGLGILMVFGWMVTAIAATLGAAFWFDLLSRFVTLRGAGRPAQATSTSPDSATGPVGGTAATGAGTGTTPAVIAASGPPQT
jgi:hypothetical protein